MLHVPPILPVNVTLPPVQTDVVPTAVMVEATGGTPLVTMLFFRSTSPPKEIALPVKVALWRISILPLARIVPLKIELLPNVTIPLTCQYILHKDAPLMSVILDDVADVRLPFIFIIKTAFAFPWASKIKLPVKVDAAVMQYTLGVNTCPFPRVVPNVTLQLCPLKKL